jgi:hypothetical protein
MRSWISEGATVLGSTDHLVRGSGARGEGGRGECLDICLGFGVKLICRGEEVTV